MHLSKSGPARAGHHRRQRDQRLTKVRLAGPDCAEDVSAPGPRKRPAPMGGRIGPPARTRQPLCETFATVPLPSPAAELFGRGGAPRVGSASMGLVPATTCKACITRAHGHKSAGHAADRAISVAHNFVSRCYSVAFTKRNIDPRHARTHGADTLSSEPNECWTKTKKPI